MRFVLILIAFVAAVAGTHVLGSSASAYFAMNALASVLPVALTPADWVRVITHDIAGMAPAYAPVMGAGLGIAFTVAGFIARIISALRMIIYMVAGAAAVVTALVVLPAVLGIQPVSGAREMFWPWGLAAQAGAGAFGGFLYALIAPYRRA